MNMMRSSRNISAAVSAIAVAVAVFCAVDARDESLCGDITRDRTLRASDNYFLTCQTFVKAGVTLTIEPGVTIKAIKDASPAAALVIERGAKIDAKGTASSPITFTTAEDVDPSAPDFDPSAHRGLWGGLIIMGKAPVTGFGGNGLEVEGLEGHFYGGNDENDNSGVMSYVRVWYGGSVVGKPCPDAHLFFPRLLPRFDAGDIECLYVLFTIARDFLCRMPRSTTKCLYMSHTFRP